MSQHYSALLYEYICRCPRCHLNHHICLLYDDVQAGDVECVVCNYRGIADFKLLGRKHKSVNNMVRDPSVDKS